MQQAEHAGSWQSIGGSDVTNLPLARARRAGPFIRFSSRTTEGLTVVVFSRTIRTPFLRGQCEPRANHLERGGRPQVIPSDQSTMIIYKCRFTGDELLSDAFKPRPVVDDEGNEVPGLIEIDSQKVNKVQYATLAITRLWQMTLRISLLTF